MIFNISENIKNRYQMLTKRRPKSECNTTVAVMACNYTFNKINSPSGIMPEDYLMDILDSVRGRRYLQQIVPGAKYNPWNDSYCIAWAVNLACEKEVCKVLKSTFQEMKSHVIGGGAIGIGGGFLSGGTSGHFVCVVGFEINENGDVVNVIVDDPYGDINEKYKDHFNGNDIKIPVKKFIKITFGRSKKKTMQLYYKTGAC